MALVEAASLNRRAGWSQERKTSDVYSSRESNAKYVLALKASILASLLRLRHVVITNRKLNAVDFCLAERNGAASSLHVIRARHHHP